MATADATVERRRRKRETQRRMGRRLHGGLVVTERRDKGGPVNDIERVEHIVVESGDGGVCVCVCEREREVGGV